jgi:D-galactarolactone cycloisomerase
LGIYVALNFIANIEPNPNRLVEKDLYIEYDQTENRIREELIIPKLIIKDGYIEIPTSPGLGVDINEEKLNQFKT